jgi:MFS family permease
MDHVSPQYRRRFCIKTEGSFVEQVARLRVLVTIFFALDGFLLANWVVCVPQVKVRVNASAGSLGLALLGISAGAVVTMILTGRLCSRFGDRRIVVISSTLMSLAIMLPGLATSVSALATFLFIFGVGFGGLNVSMNSAAVDIVGELGRPIMPRFHAAYSFGGLVGALIGGVIASVLGPAWHLAMIGLLGLLVTACAGSMLLGSVPTPATTGPAITRTGVPEDTARRNTPGTSPSSRLPLLVAVFGAIALCSTYGEGAMADWGALHLHIDLHTSVELAALGYASFSGAMVIGRLSGPWLLDRAGRTFVLVMGSLTAATGMMVAALTPVLALVIVGFVLVGLGLANLFPVAIGQAGALRGPPGVAAVSTIGYSGFLAGPPIIGFLAERTGLPIALTTVSLLAVFAAFIAEFARRAETNWIAK